jgi:lysophospholipase L1-like esterase
VDKIAQKLNIPSSRVIRTFKPFGGIKFDRSSLFADGCHPNDAGYKVLAELVHTTLNLK